MRDETLRQFLQSLSCIKINGIKRNAKGLLIELEKSNRKDFLNYEVRSPKCQKCNSTNIKTEKIVDDYGLDREKTKCFNCGFEETK